MKLSDFNYSLPQELIAQHPLPERDTSKLLALDRNSGKITHHIFKELPLLLRKGDLLVLNDTKVFNARLLGKREGFDGKIEVLLTEKKGNNIYAALCKPSRKLKEDTVIIFKDGLLKAKVIGAEACPSPRKNGGAGDDFKLLEFSSNGNLHGILERIGEVPLPPYIHRPPEEEDEDRYQTVYAKNKGAIASPTAGLHFTENLISRLKSEGIEIVYITLHVGYATFKPVTEEDISKHKMHKEYFSISKEAADKINSAKEADRRVISVGTTTCRALESAALKTHRVRECDNHATELFISPGFDFKVIDGLLTNFHLSRTTLLMLVSAFAGKDNVLKAYNEAINERYRFYSYGDAMFII